MSEKRLPYQISKYIIIQQISTTATQNIHGTEQNRGFKNRHRHMEMSSCKGGILNQQEKNELFSNKYLGRTGCALGKK